MKVLYAIQGTGNGHLARAKEIIPVLKKEITQLDILVSGTQVDLNLGHEITYRLHGMSFIFGKKGGVSFLKTLKQLCLKKIYDDIKKLPIKEYDYVINDFEPISAWAAKLHHVHCIGLSHQNAVLHPKAPKPNKFAPFSKGILKYYAPCTEKIGFHFKTFGKNIHKPIIRQEIRNIQQKISTQNSKNIVVYLPSYEDKILINVFSNFPKNNWKIFSKHSTKKYTKNNIEIHPITNTLFIKEMAQSNGVICGAGFETPAEALFLKKKLLVIPMKHQYEQYCNAECLKEMGIIVLNSLQQKDVLKVIQNWLNQKNTITVNYPDNTQKIITQITKNQKKKRVINNC